MRIFVEKLAAPAPVSLSFEQLANSLFDLLKPRIQENFPEGSAYAEAFVLRQVLNVALVVGGQRQACYVTFDDMFRKTLSAPMLSILQASLLHLRHNLALPNDFNLVIRQPDYDTKWPGGFVAFRSNRVALPDVLTSLPVMGRSHDNEFKEYRVFEPAARVLGYPIYSVHPEDVPDEDVSHIIMAAVLDEDGADPQTLVGAPLTVLIVARYASVDVQYAMRVFGKIRDSIASGIIGNVVAGKRVVRVVILRDSWASEVSRSVDKAAILKEERAGRGDLNANYKKLEEAIRRQNSEVTLSEIWG